MLHLHFNTHMHTFCDKKSSKCYLFQSLTLNTYFPCAGKQGGRPVEWMEAAGMEVKLWEQMLDRPNLWVEGSIMLRPAMDKPIYSSSMTE